jgi:hypothetical protein
MPELDQARPLAHSDGGDAAQEEGSPALRGRWEGLLYGALLAVAMGVRAWGLGARSLSLDELSVVELSKGPLLRILTNVMETNPPFYFLLIHGWTALVGTSEVSLRLPSLLFGVLAVALMERIGRQLGGARLGYIGMALMAVAPMPVAWSQIARGYTLYLAAALGAYYCLFKWIRTPTRSWACGYVAASILSAYVHYFWLFNFAAQQLMVCGVLWKRRELLRSWLVMSLAVVLGYAPWIPVLLIQVSRLAGEGFWIPRPTPKLMAGIAAQYFMWATWRRVLLLVPVALALAGLVRVERAPAGEPGRAGLRLGLRPYGPWLLAWAACPVLLPALWSCFRMPILFDRYTIAATGGCYLLVGQGVLGLRARELRWAALGAVLLLAVASLPEIWKWQPEDWRGLWADLERSADGRDLVLVTDKLIWTTAYYPAGRGQVQQLPLRAEGRYTLPAPELSELSRHPRVYLVLRGAEAQRDANLAAFGGNPGLRLVSQRSYGDMLQLAAFEVQPRR